MSDKIVQYADFLQHLGQSFISRGQNPDKELSKAEIKAKGTGFLAGIFSQLAGAFTGDPLDTYEEAVSIDQAKQDALNKATFYGTQKAVANSGHAGAEDIFINSDGLKGIFKASFGKTQSALRALDEAIEKSTNYEPEVGRSISKLKDKPDVILK